MHAWLRDPLVHCLAAGAALFALHAAFAGEGDEEDVIRVSAAQVERIATQWTARMGRPPEAGELDGLLAEHVREEALVREARRLGLDRGDVIVRRRLVQKLRFVTEDVEGAPNPDEAALRGFFEADPERYRTPERVSFSHVFFSRESRGDAAADASRLLASGGPGEAWRSRGDPFMLERGVADRPLREVARDYGDAFADALGELVPGVWSGPLASALGVHLVRLDDRAPSRIPAFESVRGRVAVDWESARRARANERHIEELVGRYRVEIAR